MKKWFLALALALVLPCAAFAGPRLMVSGVTSYDPAKTWNGFTILSGNGSAKLIDMNGNLVHEWDLKGGNAEPGKVWPGGFLTSYIYPAYKQAGQGNNTFALLDFDGNIVRSFNKLALVKKPTEGMPVDADGTAWISRSHHDHQLEGSSTGYYAPDSTPVLDGKIMLLAHNSDVVPAITDKIQLQDDRIIILDKDSKIIFDWKASDHLGEFLNMTTDPAVMKRLNDAQAELGKPIPDLEYNGFDWFHINCASWLGPNKWYDAGDKRFHPENIIADSRETSHLFIIDHETGKIVWQVAPPFEGEDSEIGAVYGVHSTHMIPKGLPGEGNIIMFDNGGTTAYHKQLPPRYYSRAVEFDPTTKKVVWEYSHTANKGMAPWQLFGDSFFFSSFISNVQRLPNGNTLICEGNKCRIFEVTPEKEIVWEYISPYDIDNAPMRYVYRAYRLPYDYVPQLPKGSEVPVTMPKGAAIQIPNDNGDYAKVAPVIDKGRAARFNPMTPVMMPGGKIAAPAASAAAAEVEEEEELVQPGMKAY